MTPAAVHPHVCDLCVRGGVRYAFKTLAGLAAHRRGTEHTLRRSVADRWARGLMPCASTTKDLLVGLGVECEYGVREVVVKRRGKVEQMTGWWAPAIYVQLAVLHIASTNSATVHWTKQGLLAAFHAASHERQQAAAALVKLDPLVKLAERVQHALVDRRRAQAAELVSTVLGILSGAQEVLP